ncbi:sensor histidine kinase [Nonomuraea sediminis]|uniref:sensor histidine kinase n=1 Tax=Nonomuraea sediminis TaxID=2835864 RepID=UPI001BDD7882|nr:ATP-binding protein [Nonomuraea sediminis]
MSRLGLRMRLTLLYGVLFFVAGSVLVWLNYALTARALEQQFTVDIKKVQQLPGMPALGNVISQQTDVSQRATSVLSETLRNSLVTMVLVGIVALVLGYLVADRALKPLDRVTETAERLSESNLHERIALKGPNDEVKRLADTFDGMLDRLHRAFDAQRRFIGNASHELRTPLAINRTVLEVALEEPHASEDLKVTARSLLGTNARYERLIEGLLLLAQSEQELTVRRPVELTHVVKTVLDQPLRKPSVTVHEDLSPALVEGDPLLLERCVFNLVENAAKYNVRGGDIWITLREGVLTVENTGPAVPPYEVEELFEPFHRQQGERVRSVRGAGLGLSIVRAIAVAHGGTVTAEPRAKGGLAVSLRLPIVGGAA